MHSNANGEKVFVGVATEELEDLVKLMHKAETDSDTDSDSYSEVINFILQLTNCVSK